MIIFDTYFSRVLFHGYNRSAVRLYLGASPLMTEFTDACIYITRSQCFNQSYLFDGFTDGYTRHYSSRESKLQTSIENSITERMWGTMMPTSHSTSSSMISIASDANSCNMERWENSSQTSNISGTLVDNKTVDHSDVVGASPIGAAPTTSSFSTYHKHHHAEMGYRLPSYTNHL